FLRGVTLSFAPFAERKQIRLDLDAGGAETLDLWFDPEKAEKIFYNLLSNAFKFTPRGGRICVRVVRKEGTVEIAVEDTGKGIPAAELPYIFDRFHQVDGSSTREQEGTGIGLSLVRDLCALHGGSVRVA